MELLHSIGLLLGPRPRASPEECTAPYRRRRHPRLACSAAVATDALADEGCKVLHDDRSDWSRLDLELARACAFHHSSMRVP